MTGLNMAPARERIRRGAAAGVSAALDALSEASARRAPVRTGRLVASRRSALSPDGQSGTVAYTAPYAARRHETGRQSGYLRIPAADPAVRETMLRALAEGFRRELTR